MDNPNVVVGSGRFGRCLIATTDLKKGEVIAEFDGPVYEAESCTKLPKDIADHAIQFEEHRWKDSTGIARFINHSCEPNCAIKGLFSIVTMRDIKKGEELLWDYDMTEDSDWRMECLCNTPSCRKVIGAFGSIPAEKRGAYKEWASDWLIQKYHLAS